MLEKLKFLYGGKEGMDSFAKLQKIIEEAKNKIQYEQGELWSEKDLFLITYPDSFTKQLDFPQGIMASPPLGFAQGDRGYDRGGTLKTLDEFLQVYLNGILSGVHILPFYPYSSDRGFSVIDFYQVKEEFGTWEDIKKISEKQRIMADLVLNHVSVKHQWFQKFLAGDPDYEDYFIWFEKEKIPAEDLKKVIRPRATPLLTPFNTAKGERWVWTTFSVENSTDQVDLNYKNPAILLEIIKIVLFFLQKGVKIFRLDAIPYIWKEIGTDCENLPQAHAVVSILRSVLDSVCPSALLISQSSVPLAENLLYFGKQGQESNIIYNFALPPLVLQSFYSENNKNLNKMAKQMKAPDSKSTYFNILAVHDGIGVKGVTGFLSDQELKTLTQEIEKRSGKLSYYNLPDGNKSVRELNITWWSAISGDSSDSFDLRLRKFITSHAIAFALAGIPAVYYLSLFGRENDLELVDKTGIKRDINRSNLDLRNLESRIRNSQLRQSFAGQAESREAKIFAAMTALIQKRRSIKAFHPNEYQEVLNLDPRIFAVLRGRGKSRVLALHNLSKAQVEVKYRDKAYNLESFGFEWIKIS